MEIRANMLGGPSTVTKNCVGPLVPPAASAKYSFVRAVASPASRRSYASLACPGSGRDAPPPSPGGSSAPAMAKIFASSCAGFRGPNRPGAESGLLQVRGLPGCRTGHNVKCARPAGGSSMVRSSTVPNRDAVQCDHLHFLRQYICKAAQVVPGDIASWIEGFQCPSIRPKMSPRWRQSGEAVRWRSARRGFRIGVRHSWSRARWSTSGLPGVSQDIRAGL